VRALVDEVTAVGDAPFQEKCRRAFAERRAKSSVVMVSHQLSTIREYYRPDVTGPAVRDGAFQISQAMGWTGELEDLYTSAPGASGLLDLVGATEAKAFAQA